MKRILFVVTYLDTGGISRSLQNLLSKIDTQSYSVDVFAISHQGLFGESLTNCRLLSRDWFMHALISRYGKAKHLEKFVCAAVKSLNKLSQGRIYALTFKRVSKKLYHKNYDAVVAFSEGIPTRLVSMMNHSNSISWIHCDYTSYYYANACGDESDIYESFKAIVNVSEFTKQSFLDIYPQFASKTHSIYNVLDDEMMKRQAQEISQHTYDSNYFNIVSVGRLDPVKRLSIIPAIASKIIQAGCKINWYVVGPKGGRNEEYDKLVEGIEEHNLQEIVILAGEQKNPYPYIKNADLLVNTSISEACPYVINEAKILHTPVACTDFGSASEFITNGADGFSVSIDHMAELIIGLIQNQEKLDALRASVEHFHYDNESIVNSFYKLID